MKNRKKTNDSGSDAKSKTDQAKWCDLYNLKTESKVQLEMVIYKQSLHYSLCDGEPS
jgi:hypothetical protein